MSLETEGLPILFIQRLKDIISQSCFEDALDAFYHPNKTAFRVNLLKESSEKVREELEKLSFTFFSVDWMQNQAWWVDEENRQKLLESTLFLEHKIYVQNLSSMLPPIILDPKPHEIVLDLAAAPGSKTIQMASMMENKGEIIAVEIVKKRFYKLKHILEEYGAHNVRVKLGNGENIWKKYPDYFDKVLIDAPCSTEARFKAYDEETYKYWNMRKVKEMVKKQNRLIFSAFNSLKVGGTMVYSTCSFAPEENEMVIDRLVDKFGDALTIEPIELSIPNVQHPLSSWKKKVFHPEVAKALRILPNERMEGFFICKIKKNESVRHLVR